MQIRFYLLRAPEIEVDGHPISDELNHKSIALLFYLAASGKKLLSRDELSELLWPNQFGDSARSNLRQTLSAIKKTCIEKLGMQDSIVETLKGNCRITSACSPWVDVQYFREMIELSHRDDTEQGKAEHLREAICQYRSSFLDGFYIKGSAAFEEWIMYERDALNRMFTEACKELSSLCVKMGRVPQAIEYMTKLLKLDSLREDVYQELIRLHLRCGDRSGAISVYKKCEKVLREELNISPMAQTRTLYELSLRAEKEPSAPAAQNNQDSRRMSETRIVLEGACVEDFLVKVRGDSGDAVHVFTVTPNPLGMLEYEGLYSLVEQLLSRGPVEAGLREGLAVLSPAWSDARPPGYVGAISDIYLFSLLKALLLSHPGQRKQVLAFSELEKLDLKTQQLLKYLWWNLGDPDTCLVAAGTPTGDHMGLLSRLKSSIPEGIGPNRIKEEPTNGNDL